MNKTVKTKTQVKVANNLEAHYNSHCGLQARYSSRFLSPPASPIFFTAPSLSTRGPSVARSSSDKSSNIIPNASAGGLREKGWLTESIAWTILVSYLSVLIEFSFSHIGYCLNVFVWLWIIGFTLASLGEGVFFLLFVIFFFIFFSTWFMVPFLS